MVYNPNKPAANDNLSDSQVDIQQNFQTANTVFSVNHLPFDNVSGNEGAHKFVELRNRGAVPGVLKPLETTLYSRSIGSGVSAASQLFLTRNDTSVEIQMSGGTDATVPFSRQQGNTFFPSEPNKAILMQWGIVASPGNTNTVTYVTPFKTATIPFSIQVSAENGTTAPGNVWISNSPAATNVGFTIKCGAGAPAKLYWIAIGLAENV